MRQFSDELSRQGCATASILIDEKNRRVVTALGLNVKQRGVFALRLGEVHIRYEEVHPQAAAIGVARLNVMLNNQHLAPVRDDEP